MLNVDGSQIASSFPDPMDPDEADDAPVVLTRRRLCRLALVATEVGARFERDGVDHDPMAWMLAPRRLFGGASAVEGALELEGCVRALIVHGLELGLDADPSEIDDLVAGSDEDGEHGDGEGGSSSPRDQRHPRSDARPAELCPA